MLGKVLAAASRKGETIEEYHRDPNPLQAWGRHGFDGIACGTEACRGLGTRNRLENHNCQHQSAGIRSLIN